MRIACGEAPDIERKFEKGSAIRYFNPPVGIIRDIRGAEDAMKLEGVREISFTKKIGDRVGSIGSSTDRVGFVIAQADTAEDAIRICERVCDTVEIVTE